MVHVIWSSYRIVEEKIFQIVICKMSAILFSAQCATGLYDPIPICNTDVENRDPWGPFY